MNFTLEVVAYSLEAAEIAQMAGADRIELCGNPLEGGTTPSLGTLKTARKKMGVQLHAMIRPRGGNFVYSDDEFEMMKTDVQICKALKYDGVVLGILKENGTVDVKRCKELVEMAGEMSVTFHRAFDRTIDPIKALNDVIDTGCERILTSGHQKTAIEGAKQLFKLIEKAEDLITIMPAGNIRAENILEIATETCATEFHSAAAIKKYDKKIKTNELLNDDFYSLIPDEKEVKQLLKILEKHFR
jgi:copper homeostasis protein